METAVDTKKQILEVSRKLFEHYGYQKTTMADIARECGMSPANIYRFYKGKDTILFEIADGIFFEVEEALREVLKRPGLSASERLSEFVVEDLRRMDIICTCNEKIDEAIQHLKAIRPAECDRHCVAKRSMIAEILAEGNRTGEFEVHDVVSTAGIIYSATFLCKCQWSNRCIPIQELEGVARGIVRLIINGVRKR